MEHPPYSPDLAPCDFFLFPKIKSALKGTRFESVEAVRAKATQLLNSLTQDDLQHCFQQWKIRMERCRDWGGDYIEGDNISIVWFFFNKGLEHESGFFIATPRIAKCGSMQGASNFLANFVEPASPFPGGERRTVWCHGRCCIGAVFCVTAGQMSTTSSELDAQARVLRKCVSCRWQYIPDRPDTPSTRYIPPES